MAFLFDFYRIFVHTCILYISLLIKSWVFVNDGLSVRVIVAPIAAANFAFVNKRPEILCQHIACLRQRRVTSSCQCLRQHVMRVKSGYYTTTADK